MEKVGVKAITLHPEQLFKCIKGMQIGINKRIKRKVNPVIGNGDVKNIDDINEMFIHTNCDGIMIAEPL